MFDVAGMLRAGRKVVGLAMLETGRCSSWQVVPTVKSSGQLGNGEMAKDGEKTS